MRKGFTLIELLIVVLIIAILAAIAVPNFLAFQVRAKVSRVKSDMRSLATALEAYSVDNGSYPCRNNEAENPYSFYGGQNEWAGFRQLTTPIGYISTVPLDPFGRSKFTTSVDGDRGPCLAMGTGKVRSAPSGPPWNADPEGFPADIWELESDGPDNWDQTRDSLSTGNFPWPNVNANSASIVQQMLGLLYDPTNGTNSNGEIFRVGGVKPDGEAWDVFWAHATGN